MSEMRVCILGPHFDTSREEFFVFFEPNSVRVNRLGEARPPRSRVILIERRIEWCPIHDIHIETWSLVIVVLIGEWSLGSFFLCDFVLDWGESVFEILFGEFFEFFSPCFLDISFASTSFFVERVSEC